MARITITRPHRLAVERARQAAQAAADKLAEDYGMSSAWRGDTLCFERSGVKGAMTVTAQHIAVNVELGLMLTPLKSTIESRLTHQLDQWLAQSSPA
ncbi:MAG TPA: polyhydroxyalkanoic acid system family protein [Burkholderiaceae bacterium]|nr:polyhydroxyalkanoic acid system family protein [Burkholderiaceae bacterium]